MGAFRECPVGTSVRNRILLSLFAGVASVTALFLPGHVLAQSGTCSTAAGFQIDGQLYSGPGGDDWAQGEVGHGVFLTVARTVQLSPAISFRDEHWAGSSVDPSHFDGESNKNNDYIGAGQNPWTSSTGSGPQKDDFTDIYIHARTDPGTGHLWLMVGGTTRAVNGDSHVDFEFNRSGISLVPGSPDLLVGSGSFGGRSIGDLIVSVDYGLGGTNPTISVRRWQENPPGSGLYEYVDVTPAVAGSHFVCVDVTGATTGPWGGIAPDGTDIAAGSPMVALQFFEGAIDLSQTGINIGDLCSAIPTLIVKSRSSDSFPAELKDYALRGFSIAQQPTCSLGGPEDVCANTTGHAFTASSSSAGATFVWSISGNGTIAGPTTGSSVTVDATGAGAFTLHVAVTDPQLSCTGACSLTVDVHAPPVVAVNSPAVCQGTNATLTATVTGGTGPFTYLWSNNATTASISVGTAGTYSVTVTDANGCTGQGSGVLTVNQNPTVAVNNATACQGFNGTLTATVTGGTGPFTYLWSNNATTASISVGTAGTYSVTVTDANGCTGQGSGTLTINQNLVVTVNNASVCQGASATLTASVAGGVGTFTYLWSNNATTASISVGTAGTYSVTVTDANGCIGQGSGVLTVNQNPTVTVNNAAVCEGSSGTLTATATGGTGPFTYLWNNNATTASISVGTAGTYSVTVTDANGCTGQGSGTLTLNPAPTCSITGPDSVCVSSIGSVYQVTATPGATISWLLTGNGTIVGATTGSSITVTAGPSGTFVLTVTVTSDAGCTAECTKTITVRSCVVNCPRTAGFWWAQCAQRGNGSTKFTPTQLTQITECMDDRSSFLDWAPGTDLTSFCAAINPTKPMDQRKQALRQYAAFLANICTGQLNLVTSNGEKIFLDPATAISCGGVVSTRLDSLIVEVDATLTSLNGQSLSDGATKSAYGSLIACLDAINNGIGIGEVCAEEDQVEGGLTSTGRTAGPISVAPAAPNPFNGITYFAVTVLGSESRNVQVRIFDVQGHMIRTLSNERLAPGRHELFWDGVDEGGRKMPSGIYFLHSAAGGHRAVSRLLYLR